MKVLSRTPSRISLFGGGCDMQSYSQQYGGVIISLAINLYQEIELCTGEDIFSGYTKIPNGISPDFAYSIMKSYGIGSWHHATIKTSFDGVVGAGLGSSGAFGVGLIAAIKKSKGQPMERGGLALEAWIEENRMWLTGKQDQFAASFGGFNILKFGEKIEILPYPREVGDQMTDYLHLFYTGGTRKSAKLQNKFETLNAEKTEYLHQIKDIALVAAKAISEGKMELVGKLLHASWEAKRSLGVSSEKVDEIYTYARNNGAMGGKLMGAGESGYMVFFVSPEKSKKFKEKMARVNLEENDFEVDWNGVKTRII